jgi:hypothetical protein
MPQTAAAGPPAGDLTHHLFAQCIVLAFRLLVLLRQFNHLLLQFHQAAIRLQFVAGHLLFHFVVSVSRHVP